MNVVVYLQVRNDSRHKWVTCCQFEIPYAHDTCEKDPFVIALEQALRARPNASEFRVRDVAGKKTLREMRLVDNIWYPSKDGKLLQGLKESVDCS